MLASLADPPLCPVKEGWETLNHENRGLGRISTVAMKSHFTGCDGFQKLTMLVTATKVILKYFKYKMFCFPNVHIPNSWHTYAQGAWDHQCHRVVWKGSWVPQYQLLSFSCRRQLPTTNHLTQTCSSGVSIPTKIFFQEKNHFLFDVHLYLLNEILSCLKSFSLRKEKKCGGWVFFFAINLSS